MIRHRNLKRWRFWLCLALASGLAVVFWTAGGAYGIMHLLDGRNPWRYVAPTAERREETIQNAEVIIAALERWKGQHDRYPGSLNELVPSELPAVPPSTIGDRTWNYGRPTPGRFVLDFFEGEIYEHSWWDSEKGQWEGDH